ncbi:helix-turn-helix domain-containing protein [Arthrobacter oryzae]|jgi:DNA-binding CsgD family transcriptional regulator|uniref:helix-turn-helix domain-containing protein n=1 Tax=Arthrobacter oryzae TaxID=409290 RepID=UPI002788F52C|nr:helix-turn-helix transcriptional regulator [Arthrobacter oryzae]MDQ0077147.1 DNA-binding CsgD family transcriptional regulator [Arthrobacter oryzae]
MPADGLGAVRNFTLRGKGIDATMDVWAGNSPFPRVIRVTELRAAIDELTGSESSGVIVTGAAGSGRTRLLAAAAEALSGQLTVIAHNIPESCRRMKFGIGSVLAPALPAGFKVSPLTIVRACRDALRSQDPGATGILLVLDNVDHLDGTSLWVLNQLLAEPDIKMLASHRSDRQLQMELMESVVARQLSVVTLEELTLEQLRTFLEYRLPARPCRNLVRDIHAASGANALTASWLVEEALAGGQIVEHDGSCAMAHPPGPGEARQFDLARRRIEALPPVQRQVVEFLAAADPAPLSVLARAVPPEALAALEQRHVIRLQIRSDGGADVTLNHEVEASAARHFPGGVKPLEMQDKASAISGRPGEESLWDLLRRVEAALEAGWAVPDLDLLAVATTANNLYDSERALRAAQTIKAPELQLMAQTEAARALFHSRQYGKSAELLRTLVETTPAVLSIEFARAVALLLQALMPTDPGRDALNSVLDTARRRLSLAAAASVGDTAADTYQNAVQDELDVLQLFLEAREGNWPSPGGELFHRLCPAGFCEAGHTGPDHAPGTHAGILLLALASQGLSVRGKSADAVELSTRALNAVERLPRCSVDLHSTVLTIHASNLTRVGCVPGAAAERPGNNWMSYPGGPLQLFRAMMFCRHAAAGRAAGPAHGAGGGTTGDPDDLLALTLGAQATADWLAWDLAQVPGRAVSPADGRATDGDVAAKLAETYAAVARPAVTGAAGPPPRTLRKPAKAPGGGSRGRRALELLNLGVTARPEKPGIEQAADGAPEWRWSSDGNSGPVPREALPREALSGEPLPGEPLPGEPLEWLPGGGGRRAGRSAERTSGGAAKNRLAVADPARLSLREREVAVLVVSGMGSARVAAELGIAVNTVNAHLQRIYGKLGVSRRQELAELWKSLDGAGQ